MKFTVGLNILVPVRHNPPQKWSWLAVSLGLPMRRLWHTAGQEFVLVFLASHPIAIFFKISLVWTHGLQFQFLILRFLIHTMQWLHFSSNFLLICFFVSFSETCFSSLAACSGIKYTAIHTVSWRTPNNYHCVFNRKRRIFKPNGSGDQWRAENEAMVWIGASDRLVFRHVFPLQIQNKAVASATIRPIFISKAFYVLYI